MATIHYQPISEGTDAGVVLSSAQTGTGDSTNVMDRGAMTGPGAVEITTTNTSSVTVNIMGSNDGVAFDNIPYALQATPETPAVASIVIASAVTTIYRLRPFHAWRYLKLNMSANAGNTVTATAWSR